MNRSVRTPAVAGAFYPSDPEELRRTVLRCFTDPRGPGAVPRLEARAPRRIRAVVVPHAGYVYSGPIAARAYAEIAGQRPPAEVLLLGVDHTGNGAPFGLSARPWRTPLGDAAVADDLVDRLRGGPVEIDESSHAEEHSLEVQLPFLQTVLPGVPFAALTVRFGSHASMREVATRVAEAVHDRDVLLIASTDFSHYVDPDTAERLDALAIAEILARDGNALYQVVVDRSISMCGIAPTTVLLHALASEPLTARFLGWSHSGAAEPMARVVGYAAAVFEGPASGRA